MLYFKIFFPVDIKKFGINYYQNTDVHANSYFYTKSGTYVGGFALWSIYFILDILYFVDI